MHCPKCQFQNEENAHFCINCGTNLQAPQAKTKGDNTSSILLFVFIIFKAVFCLYGIATSLYFMLKGHFHDGNDIVFDYVKGVLGIIDCLVFILIPLSIKNKTLKIIGLVVVVAILISWGYNYIDLLLHSEERMSLMIDTYRKYVK